MIRVMVGDDQPIDVCLSGDLNSLAEAEVTPSLFVFELIVRVLGVMDQHIGVSQNTTIF